MTAATSYSGVVLGGTGYQTMLGLTCLLSSVFATLHHDKALLHTPVNTPVTLLKMWPPDK